MRIQFDNIIIGSGQAAPFLAMRRAKSGETTALIERKALGGTCVNTGCTPTKTLRKSARVAFLARRAAEFGVDTGEIAVDFSRAIARMRKRALDSRISLEDWVRGEDRVTVLSASARIEGAENGLFIVRAGDNRIAAARLFINTGTRPFIPPIEGLLETPHLTNESLLELKSLPSHLAIIGGGYIGLEFAQIFRRLGSRVTVMDPAERLTPREDEDFSELLRDMLASEGVEIVTGGRIKQTVKSSGGVSIMMSDRRIDATHLLVATGRTPNTQDLGLDTIGIEIDSRGYVPVNDRLETSVQNVFALGDINRRGAFTHTSYHDFEIVADNLDGGARSGADRPTTYSMYTDPPLAHVGIYENDARALAEAGRRISMAVFDMANVSRAKEESETIGRIKIFIDEDNDRFLGFGMLGINSDEIMHIFAYLMAAQGSVSAVRKALPAHPTVAEFLPTILDARKPLPGGEMRPA